MQTLFDYALVYPWVLFFDTVSAFVVVVVVVVSYSLKYKFLTFLYSRTIVDEPIILGY